MLNNLIGLPQSNLLGLSNDLYPKFDPIENFVSLTLMNANALFNPCLLYGHYSE